MAPAEPDEDPVLAWKRQRREAARMFHPDRGGSAEELMCALDEADRRLQEQVSTVPRVVVRRGRLYRFKLTARRVRALVALARARMPANWPGSQRFTQL